MSQCTIQTQSSWFLEEGPIPTWDIYHDSSILAQFSIRCIFHFSSLVFVTLQLFYLSI